MVLSRKEVTKTIRKNNNYEFRIKKCKEEEQIPTTPVVKRKSNLFDRYSSDSHNVERRKRTTSGSTDNKNRPKSMTIGAIQEICLVDIKTQLLDITKKINKLTETTEARLQTIESKLENIGRDQ